MRLLGAALFVVFGLTLFIAGMSLLSQSIHGKWLDAAIPWMMGATFLFLIAAASRIFAEPQDHSANQGLGISLESHAEFVARMESEGLLVDHEYWATRAMVFTDVEHGTPYYFVETGEGVLFISWGSDEDIDDDGNDEFEDASSIWPPTPSIHNRDAGAEIDEMPTFPTTDFTVRLHRQIGDVIDVVCRGDILTAERLDEATDGCPYLPIELPANGSLITDRSYDAIRTEILSASKPSSRRSRFLRRLHTD